MFVYNVKKEQGRARLYECLKSAASGFERLGVCFSVHALTPYAHLLVPIGSVCQRETRMGRKMFKINSSFFHPPLYT